MGAFVSFDQGRIHNSSLDTSISYIVHCVYIYIYIYTYPRTYVCISMSVRVCLRERRLSRAPTSS